MSSDGQSVYALTDSPLSLQLSNDYGSNWMVISPSELSFDMYISASKNFEVLFAGNTISLTVTFDKGQTWEFIDVPFILSGMDCSDTGQYLFASSNRYHLLYYN